MKKCKHENAEHMAPGDSSTPDWLVLVYAECEQFRCIDCGAWLSLGPASPPPRDELALARAIGRIPEVSADETDKIAQRFAARHSRSETP